MVFDLEIGVFTIFDHFWPFFYICFSLNDHNSKTYRYFSNYLAANESPLNLLQEWYHQLSIRLHNIFFIGHWKIISLNLERKKIQYNKSQKNLNILVSTWCLSQIKGILSNSLCVKGFFSVTSTSWSFLILKSGVLVIFCHFFTKLRIHMLITRKLNTKS